MNLFTEQQDYFEALPLSSCRSGPASSWPWWDELMDHPVYDDFWRQGSYEQPRRDGRRRR